MKKVMLLFLSVTLFFMGACSDQLSENSSMDVVQESSDYAIAKGDENEIELAEEADEASGSGSDSIQEVDNPETNRKVIYTADLQVEAENYSNLAGSLQSETAKLGGYVVESNMYRGSEGDPASGHITVRIPQDKFDTFIQVVESGSSKVVERSVSGQDVTEEFIDLESRLKSKRTVEERLLEFMGNAEKTEDLLAISSDLSNVQEEIETIIGRMNYLEDKTAFATVTIHIIENNITMSSINDDELNTWEETKRQFMRSINFIVSAFSGLVVFFGGNFPVLALIGIIVLVAAPIIRKKIKQRPDKDSKSSEE